MRESRLPNGVRVLSERIPFVRSAAVGVWIRQGSAHETPELMGVSHLLEHMVFKGTRRRSGKQLVLELESLGGTIDAYTSREHTSYQVRVLDAHLPVAVDVLSDLVLEPTLTAEDLELEREVVLEEIATVEDTPDDLVFELHGERLWDGHPYGRSILGTRDTVGALDEFALKQLHRERYRGGDLIVAAAGNVEHDALLELVGTALGGLDEGSGVPDIPPPLGRVGGHEWVERDTTQAHIVFGTVTPGQADPRRYPLVLLTAAFGGGMSSRLFQRIREELALGYAVYAYQSFYSQAGVAGVYLGTRPAWGERAVEAIREEYAALARDGLPQEELDQIKQQVKGQVMLSLESTGARLHRLASFALHDEPFRTLDDVLAEIDAVEPEDVLGVAQEFFDPDRPFLLTLGPASP